MMRMWGGMVGMVVCFLIISVAAFQDGASESATAAREVTRAIHSVSEEAQSTSARAEAVRKATNSIRASIDDMKQTIDHSIRGFSSDGEVPAAEPAPMKRAA